MSDVQASRDPIAGPHSSRATAAHALAHVSGNRPSVRISGTGAGTEAFLRGPGDRWVRLHSGRDPVGEAARWLESSLPDGIPDFLVVVGAGLGYVLDVLESKRANVRVLALEPEPAIVPAMRGRRDWEGWLRDGRLTILTGPDYAGQGEAWRQVPQAESPVPVLVHPVLRRERPEAVKAAERVAARILFDARANASSRAALAGTYLLHTLANTGVIAREGDAGALFETFPGVPAIVIGAGPSLDDNLDALATVGDRGLLISADTALRPLLSAGIAPHLVVAADPSDHNARHLERLPPCGTTWLVAEGSVGRAAFETFAGRSFVFRLGAHEPWPWLESLGLSRASLRAWGSVVTSAFDLAIHAGCDPIIFAGLDLAFTRERPYCRGTTWEEDWAREALHGGTPPPLEATWRESLARWKLTTECGVDGKPVATAPHLQAFRTWIAEQTPALSRRVINGTGAGILSGGTIEQRKLGAALRDALPATSLDLQSILRRARARDRGIVNRHDLRTGLADALAATAGANPSDPVRRWIAFATDVGPDAIRLTLDEARRMLDVESPAPPRIGSDCAVAESACSALPGAIRIPPPERMAIIHAALNGESVPEWVRGSADVRTDQNVASESLMRALEEALAVDRPSFANLEQVLAALMLRSALAPGEAAMPPRLLATLLTRRCRGDAETILAGLISRSPWLSADPCQPMSVVARRSAGSLGLLDRVLTHVASGRDAMTWLEPKVLTEEVGRGATATTYDDYHAIVTPYGGLQSVLIAEDGSHRPGPAWPKPIVAEVPLGPDGGALAWCNGEDRTHRYVMLRPGAQREPLIEPLPFQAGAAVRVEASGSFLFPAYSGGLWRWHPGRGATRLVETPPLIGLAPCEAGIRLDPIERDSSGQPVRCRAAFAFIYTEGTAHLAPMPLDARGQRQAMATAAGWTASTFPHADLVYLSHEDGRALDLSLDYPVAVAWAGASLIVANIAGDICLFRNLQRVLEELPTTLKRTTNG